MLLDNGARYPNLASMWEPPDIPIAPRVEPRPEASALTNGKPYYIRHRPIRREGRPSSLSGHDLLRKPASTFGIMACLGMIFSENRHPLFGIMACLGMIFSENRHPLFGIMACLGMIFSENRHPLFGIMP
jgi:hypothetical protein